MTVCSHCAGTHSSPSSEKWHSRAIRVPVPLDVDGQSNSRQDVCNIYPESLTVDSQDQRWYRGLFAYQY